MSAFFHLLEAAQEFRPIGSSDLPVFRWDGSEYGLFYAPGYVCVTDRTSADVFEDLIGTLDRNGEIHPPHSSKTDDRLSDCAASLRSRAAAALAAAHRLQRASFLPECLLLYLNNECNLRCAYCHTAPSREPQARLKVDEIISAAETVAINCAESASPLRVAFHGGGEPSLHSDRVDRIAVALRDVALRHDLSLHMYVATNGVMSPETAVWLARTFDLIGLSCDGPPELHDGQRPSWDNGPTSHIVERTGRILHEQGANVHVRATITHASLERQVEIVEHIYPRFLPREIRFEPVYVTAREPIGLTPRDGDAFAHHFLQAHRAAARHGVPLTTSGFRPNMVHGPYCNIFRSTLNLVPGGCATCCFELSQAEEVRAKGMFVGTVDPVKGRFDLDHDRIAGLRKALSVMPGECRSCFNSYHCTRGCPDTCALVAPSSASTVSPDNTFRCRAHKALAYAVIRNTADHLWQSSCHAAPASAVTSIRYPAPAAELRRNCSHQR